MLRDIYEQFVRDIPSKLEEYGRGFRNICNPGDALRGIMTPESYVCYLLFEGVSLLEKERQKKTAKPIRAHIEGMSREDRSSLFGTDDPDQIAKKLSNELKFRNEARSARMDRLGLPPDENLMAGLRVKERSDYHKGYSLTDLQFEQLLDGPRLDIKKNHRLRQFGSASHVKKQKKLEKIMEYYGLMVREAEKAKTECDPGKRVIRAINFNDLENDQEGIFLYHTAQYCSDRLLSAEDLEPETYKMLAIAMNDLKEENHLTVTRKPVLKSIDYIPAACLLRLQEFKRLRFMRILAYPLIGNELLPVLEKADCDYEEIDEFFLRPSPLSGDGGPMYDLFGYFSSPTWETPESTGAVLEKLIDRLTIDSLSG